MAQINVTVDDQIAAEIDRVAEAKGMRRPDLVRSLLAEMIEAHDAGRAMFQSEAAPRLDASVNKLVYELRETVMELDRAQSENARLIGRLIDKWNGGEEAALAAQKRIWEKFRQQDADSLDPFKKAVASITDDLSALPDGLAGKIEPQLAEISRQLGTSIELAKQPREVRAIYLGDDRILSLTFLSGCAGIVLTFGVLIGLMLPGISDGWSASQANRLIAGPAQMCRVISAEYGVDDCSVPASERDLGLRVIAREGRR